MAVVDREQLRKWFTRKLYPKQAQFWDWIDSFVHKNDKIELGRVDGLAEQLNGKFTRAEGEALDSKIEGVKSDLGITQDNVSALFDSVDELEEKVDINAQDITGLREQIKNESHFRGYVQTREELDTLTATPNDYAWLVEIVPPYTTSDIWRYDGTAWKDTGLPVPDQTIPKSKTVPLADGEASVGTENAYAAGDHRHPTDPTRASKQELQNYLKNASANNFTQQLLNGALRFMGVTNGGTDSVIFYDKDNNAFLVIKVGSSQFGRTGSETVLVSKASDLLHNREGDGSFPIWDAYNLPIATVNELKALLTKAATKDDLNNYWKAGTSEGSIASVDELDTFVARKSGVYYVINSSDYKQLTVFRNNQGASASALEIYNDYLLNILKVRTTIQGDRYSPFYDIWTSKSLPNPATKEDLKNYARNTRATKFQTTGTVHSEITTAQFIAFLKEQGAFDGSGYWSTMGTWKFADNDVITDTGCGDVTLAGAYVELLSMSETEYDIRISTAPTRGGEENAITNAVFICRVRSGIPLKWERLANISDLSGYLPATGKAKYLEATYPSGVQYPNEVPENSAVARMIRLTGPHVTSDINGYADVVFMDAYAGGDIPAVTGIGVMKNTAGRAFVFSGLRTEDNSTPWTVKELATKDDVAAKQDTLVSGQNIKTINGQSILGADNIEIAGVGSSWNVVEIDAETGQPVPAVNVTGNTIFRTIGSVVNNSLTFNIENPSDMGTSLLKAGESFKVVCYAVIDVTFNAENIGSRMFDLDWESQSGAGTGSESYMEYEVTYTGQELLFKRRRFTYANE